MGLIGDQTEDRCGDDKGRGRYLIESASKGSDGVLRYRGVLRLVSGFDGYLDFTIIRIGEQF